MDCFLILLTYFNFNNISKHEEIDEAYSNFENSIIKTLDKHAPIKRRIFLTVVAFVG
jgi:hypothetical protein